MTPASKKKTLFTTTNMIMETIIRYARPNEAPQIADLMIEAMNRECCAWFYGEGHTLDEWRRFLITLIQAEDTQYSYLNTLVCVKKETEAITATPQEDIANFQTGKTIPATKPSKTEPALILGILISYDGSQLHTLRQPFFRGVKEWFDRDVSSIPDETAAGELYYDSLAVRSNCRHQGFATALLRAGMQRAKHLGINKVGLLVDTGNPRAERLYRQLGFVQEGENQWGGHQMLHLTHPV